MRGNGHGVRFLDSLVGHKGRKCVTWPFGACNGYGHFGHHGKLVYAHRYICELVKGPPPSPDHEAAHNCGRGHLGCVNPNHLEWKTKSENQADRRLHGRKSTGRWGKISFEQAQEIRALKGRMTQKEVAALYGISRSNVSMIMLGKARAKEMKGFVVSGGRYYARIRYPGDPHETPLGGFDTEAEARAAYRAAKQAHSAALEPNASK